MITIPTRDLCGILSDAVPFAAPDDDIPILNAIRVEWDGALHAMATDRYRIAWSTWDPADGPDDDEQGDLFHEPGGDDAPWHIHIPLADAKDIVAAYKLAAKEPSVPLTVERRVDANGGPQLVVERSRLTGHSAITMVVRDVTGDTDPDIRGLLAQHDTAKPVTELAYTAKYLADFAKVRQRGPMRLTFTGQRKPTLVAIGERFVGAIQPVREGEA